MPAAQYVGAGGRVSRVWLSAESFPILSTGTPSLSTTTTARWPAWFLDAATREGASTSLMLPTTWTSMTVKVYWANGGAGAGSVVWSLIHEQRGAGETLDAADVTESNVTAAADAQNVVVVTTLRSGLAVTGTEPIALRLDRVSTDAADTLANDCLMLGVMLEAA